jgi:hypothetical protein
MRELTHFVRPVHFLPFLFLVLASLIPATAQADSIVNISSTPGLTLLTGSPLNFSFDYDVTTNTVIGTPTIDFMGMVFAYSPASIVPFDFDFKSGSNEITIGDIGAFPQPGIKGFPGVGTYPAILVDTARHSRLFRPLTVPWWSAQFQSRACLPCWRWGCCSLPFCPGADSDEHVCTILCDYQPTCASAPK